MASHAREGHKAERREPHVIRAQVGSTRLAPLNELISGKPEISVAPADVPPQSPLDFTLAVMRDPLKPDALRASLAKAALPYVHGRWCPLGSDPRDAIAREAAQAGEAIAPQDVDGTQLGLARVASDQTAASRVNPTCGDEPGHDENKERANVLEQRALAAEAALRESDQRALMAQTRMREMEQHAVAAESRVAELAARESASEEMLAQVKTQWPDIFDASGAVRAPAASERDRLAQLVAAQERARDLEERAIMAEGALREAQFRARDMEQRACAAEELIAGRR